MSRAAIAKGELDDHRGVVAVVATSMQSVCSGVVIAPRVVLTARHCVAPIEHGPTVDCALTSFGDTVDAGTALVHIAYLAVLALLGWFWAVARLSKRMSF